MKAFHRRHRDFEFIDEVRIKTVPRYKTSGMSGDEWRMSAVAELYFKGELVGEARFSTVRTALRLLDAKLDMDFDLSGEVADKVITHEKDRCDQPGCDQRATTKYSLKRLACNEGWLAKDSLSYYVQYCARHAQRGDCGLEDADANYEVIEGPGPDGAKPKPDDESPSGFGGVIGGTS